MRRTNRAILFSALSLIWGLFIFSQSIKTGAVSEQMSMGIVSWIAQFFHIDAELLHVLVRKGAHFGEYLLLGVLLSLTMREAGLLPRTAGQHGVRRGKTALFLSPYRTQKANLFLWVFHEKWEEVPFPLYFSRRSLIIGIETDFGFSEII